MSEIKYKLCGEGYNLYKALFPMAQALNLNKHIFCLVARMRGKSPLLD